MGRRRDDFDPGLSFFMLGLGLATLIVYVWLAMWIVR